MEWSIALHAEVARRIGEDPAIVERARARVEALLEDGSVARAYALRWQAVLALPPEELALRLVDSSEEAQDLRQVSPFAGALDPRTRWRILRDVSTEVPDAVRALVAAHRDHGQAQSTVPDSV